MPILITHHTVNIRNPHVMHDMPVMFSTDAEFSALACHLSFRPGSRLGVLELSGFAQGPEGRTGLLTFVEAARLHRSDPAGLPARIAAATGLTLSAIPGAVVLPEPSLAPTPTSAPGLACPTIAVTRLAARPAAPQGHTLPAVSTAHLQLPPLRGANHRHGAGPSGPAATPF